MAAVSPVSSPELLLEILIAHELHADQPCQQECCHRRGGEMTCLIPYNTKAKTIRCLGNVPAHLGG